MIVFSSLEFIFRFLPVFLIIYYLTPAGLRDIPLLLGSVFVYAVAEPKMVFVLLAAVFANAFFGYLISESDPSEQIRRRYFLVWSVLLNVGLLTACKVLALKSTQFVLPLGISFYIFKMISYQADLYTGKITEKTGLLKTAAYFTMFPQVTQGPIMRYSQGGFDGKNGRRCPAQGIENGLVFFVIGLALKLLLADRIGILFHEITKIGYESISTPLAWMGAYAYSFQLYYDFWGYSLMAAGLGLMLGFPFIRNFDHPYCASGVADFYRRWHQTLGQWFRDYVYIPLGGSRNGVPRTILSLFVVWVLTGLWHGGTMNFVIWGLVLFVLIVWEKFALKQLMKMVPAVGRFHVWVFIPLTWVVFAIPDLKDLAMYFTRLFPFFGTGVAVQNTDFIPYLKTYAPYLAAGVLLAATPLPYGILVKNRKNPLVLLLLTVLFWICVYRMSVSSGNAFMYFSF
ncbi:MAG: MBOAT family protein [Oscillospiraceae bacterium]|nr:MBOAT family protein [Oscillospiraceae bacterium]